METIKEQPLGLIFILTRDLRVLIYAIKPIDQRTRFENCVGCRFRRVTQILDNETLCNEWSMEDQRPSSSSG